MPRRGNIAKRDVLPDPIYNSKMVTRLINNIMLDGKKGVAQKIVYGAFDIVTEKTGKNGLEAFEEALENIMPVLECKTRRVGGANYQIPFPINGHRQLHFAMMWLVAAARGRNGMPYAKRLEAEIVDAYNETGTAFKKKEDTHRMAEANRAFAHFARG